MGVLPEEEERAKMEQDRRGWSAPQHEVRIAYSFAVGKYEVTRYQYQRFQTETKWEDGNACYGLQSIPLNDVNRRAGLYIMIPGLSWRQPGFPQVSRHPVACVSWEDARAYAAWLSKKTGKRYRLLSEAEWEYVARAGAAAPIVWDGNPSAACDYANIGDLTLRAALPGGPVVADCRDGYWHTAPVGLYQPNAFGLYDMVGNVWEWTEDCWHANYLGAPSDGSAWTAGDCGRRIVRGSAYNTRLSYVRFGYRFGDVGGARVFDTGVRVARDFE